MAIVLILSISTWLFARAGITDGIDANTLNYTIMFLAYAKGSLIIYHYMEIRWAPVWLKAACASWVTISFLSVVGISAYLQ